MRALLRFQAVVVARLAGPIAIAPIALGLVLAWMARRPGWVGVTLAEIAMLVAAPVMVVAVVRTLWAVEATRWSLPLRSRDVLAAHLIFWFGAWTAFALLFVACHGTSDAGNALLEVLAIVLFGGICAAATSVFLRLEHRRRALDVVFAVVPALLTLNGTLVGTAISLGGAPSAGAPFLAVSFCIWLAVAVVARRGDERAPAAPVAAPAVAAPRAEEARPARRPDVSILRTTYASGWAWFWMAFGVVMQFLSPSAILTVIWTPIVGSNLVRLGLSTWRWLLASPIARRRAFRLLFAPALAFVVLATAVRFTVVEFATDRSAFFHDSRTATLLTVRLTSLRLTDVLEMTPGGLSYRPPDVARIAARVSYHLHEHYGVRVSEERVAASIRRGWPDQPSTGIMDTEQWAVLDAMERVRADLAPELVAASRARDSVNALASLLLFLLLSRFEFGSRRRRFLGLLILVLAAVCVLFLRQFVPGWSSSDDWLYAPFVAVPWPATLFVCAVALIAGAHLCMSSARAFCRMDLLDLPYPLNAWGVPKAPTRRTDH